jgi:hypothetical protein
MPFVFIALFICSCSPQRTENNVLPRYSDMGAAEDAGKAK